MIDRMLVRVGWHRADSMPVYDEAAQVSRICTMADKAEKNAMFSYGTTGRVFGRLEKGSSGVLPRLGEYIVTSEG